MKPLWSWPSLSLGARIWAVIAWFFSEALLLQPPPWREPSWHKERAEAEPADPIVAQLRDEERAKSADPMPSAREVVAEGARLGSKPRCHDPRCRAFGRHRCHDLDCKQHKEGR